MHIMTSSEDICRPANMLPRNKQHLRRSLSFRGYRKQTRIRACEIFYRERDETGLETYPATQAGQSEGMLFDWWNS